MLVNYQTRHTGNERWVDYRTKRFVEKPSSLKTAFKFTGSECFGYKELLVFNVNGTDIYVLQYCNEAGTFLHIHLNKGCKRKTLVSLLCVPLNFEDMPSVLRELINQLILAGLSERNKEPTSFTKEVLVDVMSLENLSEYLGVSTYLEKLNIQCSYESGFITCPLTIIFQLQDDVGVIKTGNSKPKLISLTNPRFISLLKDYLISYHR